MIGKINESIKYAESALFVVLFFLFISAFSGNHEKLPYRPFPDKFSVESQLNADVIDIQQLLVLKIHLPVVNKIHPKLFNEGLQSIADKNYLLQKILFLRNAGIILKPILFQQLYTCFHSIDTDDPPVLS